jgi:hypothetical protein
MSKRHGALYRCKRHMYYTDVRDMVYFTGIRPLPNIIGMYMHNVWYIIPICLVKSIHNMYIYIYIKHIYDTNMFG